MGRNRKSGSREDQPSGSQAPPSQGGGPSTVAGGDAGSGGATRRPTPPPTSSAPARLPASSAGTRGSSAPASPSSSGSSARAARPGPSSRPSAPAASTSAASSSSEMLQKLALQPPTPAEMPPVSSKAVVFPRRPGYGTIGKKCMVRANHFFVEVADKRITSIMTCYLYLMVKVSISPEITSKQINRKIIERLDELYRVSHLGGRRLAYDGRKSLYTAGLLPFESKEFLIKFVENEGASNTNRKERQFKVAFKFAARGDLHHLKEYLKGRQLDCPQEIIQVLDVVLRATPSKNTTTVGRSFFSPNLGRTGELGDGVEYWRGYYQSLRPVQIGLSLNVDLTARAFYEPLLVTDFIVKHFNFMDMSRPLSDHDRIKVKKALKGVKVEISHSQYARSYKISGISNQPASQILFTLDDQKTKISVVQYFRQKYNITLRYPHLPAIQAGNDAKPVYLPMELCKIASGQRYTKRLNKEQVTALLKATRTRPSDRQAQIGQMVVKNNYLRDDIVAEFGIKVKNELARVDARVLPPPKLKYHHTGREPNVDPWMGQWNMINKKMVNGGRVDTWTCVSFSTRLDRNFPFMFCKQLVEMCNSKGMAFNPQPVIPIRNSDPRQIERALSDIHKESVAKLASLPQQSQKQLQLLIIILPDMTGSYGKIKRTCDTELGIVSQCCHPKEASKLGKQYFENVALKINVKVGGRNTVLDAAVNRRIPRVSDKPTIIFGADVTHPQPGDDASPSIAAVVASMDWPEITKYRGLISDQSHREEIIQDLYQSEHNQHKSMVRELLIAFRRSTGFKPARIIFYRDGVSEGQFSQVLLYEMDAIRKACNSLEDGYLPPVTFVVVQKRHHTRFFPENHSNRDSMDKSGNILPGTVVDTQICHPSEFDFYLNSHAGIQGTSRPAHYHVLHDENNFSADDLQMLTNSLCYTYARCTRSVSLVPPAYYAHLAAFRARYYIESDASDSGSSGGRTGHGSGAPVEMRKLPSVKDNVKDVMFYC